MRLEKDKQQMRLNWLAPAGSEAEARIVDHLLQHHRLKPRERELLLRWKNDGDKRGMHHHGFWKVAKKLDLTGKTYETALERHEQLGDDNTWFVAYYVAQEKANKEIEEALGLTRRGVDYHLDRIRRFIRKDTWQAVSREDIRRWFVGQ